MCIENKTETRIALEVLQGLRTRFESEDPDGKISTSSDDRPFITVGNILRIFDEEIAKQNKIVEASINASRIDFLALGAKAAERDGAEARRDGWTRDPVNGWKDAALDAYLAEIRGMQISPTDEEQDLYCEAYCAVIDALVD